MVGRKGTEIFAILTAVVILLSACAKNGDVDKQGNGSGTASEVEYSYVPEFTELGGGEFISFEDILFAGDYLYYNQVFFDVVNQKYKPVLKQYSLTEKGILRERDMIIDTGDGLRRQVVKYYVLENGNMYTVETISYTDSSGATLLCSYDSDWNLRWEQDITSAIHEGNQYRYVDYITVDTDGRIYLAAEDIICLFDAEGMYQRNVAGENVGIGRLWTDRGGRVYVCYWNQSDVGQMDDCLAEIDFEKGKFGDIYNNFSAGKTIAAGWEEDVLISSAGHLFRYSLATQSAEEILDWAECGINEYYVKAVSAGEDGELMAFYQDYSEGESFLVCLKRVETATLPEKTQIIIGCLRDSSELQSAVSAFNRQSESCYVTLMNYALKEDGTKANVVDFVNALDMALATGIDCPDILFLDHMEAYEMDVEAIAGNGAFADLWPFLESSSLLNREDYLKNALDCYQYQGQLVGIPCEIVLETVVGRASELGQKSGWTLEEMMAYAAAHAESQLFSKAVRQDILQDCLVFGLDAFIDWETGQCHFDSEDFKELLVFVETFPAEYDYWADDRTTPRRIQEGEVLLYRTRIEDFYRIQEHQVMFEGPVTYIGYPTVDGSGCIAKCSGALALSAQSGKPEAAWEFMEYYLDRFRSRGAGFSTRKSLLDRQMEEAVTDSYYLDEEGNFLLDADGKPVSKSLGGIRWSFEDDEITFRTATEEEVNCVKELIESALPVSTADDRIMDIIREEAEPFFRGQKSVEKAAEIIQSRVQNYLDERY